MKIALVCPYDFSRPGGVKSHIVSLSIHLTMIGHHVKIIAPHINANAVEEGKILYQQHCRPCHGSKADGEGPWSNTFRLKPANFRDPGTIGTTVENYPVWRIQKGGPGLPAEATPWDSTMPPWEPDFNMDQIWKIIMGEYVTADVSPRQPEVIHE